VVLTVLGWFRGFVAQCAAVLAILGGIWAGATVKQWVGVHWLGAHPAVVFWALSWLVALLSGLAILALVDAFGDRVSQTLHKGPTGWLDAMLGMPAGAALGVAFASLLVLAAVRLPMGSTVERSLARSWAPRPLLAGGAKVCGAGARFPGALGLRREFVLALERLERGAPSK
jgi:uncharacterized membrane protein required for colicin V production